MYIAFLNPQGNFDPEDSYWTEHPDFGGQLVYVKEVARQLGAQGHQIDIITRQIVDPEWPEFESRFDAYPDSDGIRIVRIPCGPEDFLPKEELWPYLGPEWVPNIREFYVREGQMPDVFTAHYADGGLAATLLHQDEGVPFTFTAHSLGALKMDKLGVDEDNIAELNKRFRFARRISAERLSMNFASRVITSTLQERMVQYGHPAYDGAIDPKDEERFALIPPGVNRRIFNSSPGPKDQDVSMRIDHALSRDIHPERLALPIILASSRLDPKKNLLGLVRAFSSSNELQGFANLALVIRSLQDPLRNYHQLDPLGVEVMKKVVSQIDQGDLWGKVTAFPLNSQGELAAAYRRLSTQKSVFALTAFHEPFGLAPLEAMSCGLPVVVTQHGGPAESLREGGQEFGVLVDPADEEDIARGLLRLLQSDEGWQAFQRRGRERVDQRYTWSKTAAGYLRIFEAIRSQPLRSGEIMVPTYFINPRDETDIPLDDLKLRYLDD